MSKPEQAVAHACADVRWMLCACILAGLQPLSTCPCKGTGLLFPGLSMECYKHVPAESFSEHRRLNGQCDCHDGRMSIGDTDAWLAAASSLHHQGSFVSANEDGGRIFHSFMINNDFYGQGATRVEAIQEAVCKAVGAHV